MIARLLTAVLYGIGALGFLYGLGFLYDLGSMAAGEPASCPETVFAERSSAGLCPLRIDDDLLALPLPHGVAIISEGAWSALVVLPANPVAMAVEDGALVVTTDDDEEHLVSLGHQSNAIEHRGTR